MAHDPSPLPGVEFYGEWKTSKKPHRLSRHKNAGLEIVLVSKGELRWEVENREVELRADMLFYTFPWQEHGGVEEMQPSCEISYLCLTLAKRYAKPQRRFRFHRSLGFTAAEERLLSFALVGSPVQAAPADGEITWLFAHFFRVVRTPAPFRQNRARDTLRLILAHLAELAPTGRNPAARSDEAERRVLHFTRVLARRHAEPWTLKSMSEECRLGRTQFSELLQKHTGDTPVTHLNRLRLREAQRLLAQSDRPITEIALAVGFNSSQYFATVFKEFTDLDPRSFRARALARGGRE
jgi:AraC family L-rhamnose operon regulatory protein RhaS